MEAGKKMSFKSDAGIFFFFNLDQEKSDVEPLREDVGLHRGLHRPAPRRRFPWLVPQPEGNPSVVREAEKAFLVPIPQSVPRGLDRAVHGHGVSAETAASRPAAPGTARAALPGSARGFGAPWASRECQV